MNFERFLQESASTGTFHSEGAFSVDLSKATEKVAAFALPSDSHYLLKGVQVANRLKTETINVSIGRYGTKLSFDCADPGVAGDLQGLHTAVADPLNVEDPLLKDLIALLYGTIKPGNRETTWTCKRGGKAEALVIDSSRKVRSTRCDVAMEGTEQVTLELSVTHGDVWKFWLHARRRAQSAAILRKECAFSPARLVIDGWQAETANPSVFNVLEDITDLTDYGLRKHPASNVLFTLPEEGDPVLCLQRPSMSAYLVRKEVMNVWATGMRVNNTLVPDGVSTAAWMLQFRRGGENLSMRWVHKRDLFKSVIAFHFDNKLSKRPPRLQVVRAGVLLCDEEIADSELRAMFRGCVILLADDALDTDLTGFQLIKNEAYLQAIRRLEPQLEAAREYFEIGAEMMKIPRELSDLTL